MDNEGPVAPDVEPQPDDWTVQYLLSRNVHKWRLLHEAGDLRKIDFGYVFNPSDDDDDNDDAFITEFEMMTVGDDDKDLDDDEEEDYIFAPTKGNISYTDEAYAYEGDAIGERDEYADDASYNEER